MPEGESTRWSLIRGAADGDVGEREEFARRYDSVIRAYLGARWRHSPLVREMDDAAQEVYVDCFRPNGALDRADPDGPSGFRGFLYGVVRNVARRFEERRARAAKTPDSRFDPDALASREAPLSEVFDRSWARALIEEAGRLHERRAREDGDDARRRVELLRLRFAEGLPIREIAALWDEDSARLHHEYAKARDEFRVALRDVVDSVNPGSHRAVEEECARLAAFFR